MTSKQKLALQNENLTLLTIFEIRMQQIGRYKCKLLFAYLRII